MKKILFVPMCILIASVCTFAQPIVGGGIQGGINFATLGGDGSTGSEGTTQYAFGGYLEIQYPSGFAIQPEFMCSVKGLCIPINESVYNGSYYVQVTGTATQTLSYFDILMLLKYNLPTEGVGFGLYAGPSLGVLMSASIKAETNMGNIPARDNKEIYSNTDIGIVVGAGLKIPMGEIGLTLDARYNIGVTSVDKGGIGKVYNRVFSILAGLAF
jgi:hypothetical protein